MKKAQIEIMGLVIIVVLLVFIAVFSLPFIIKEKSKALNEDYLQLYANNLRSVVLNTNLCDSGNVMDEIISCYYGAPICLEDCNDIEDKIREIIESSLDEKINYKFTIDEMIVSNGECTEKVTSSKAFIEEREVKVELCYRR
jgi:hypothetical protein